MKTTITVIVDTDADSVIPAVLEHITASLGTLLMVNEATAAVATQPKAAQGAVTGWHPIATAPQDGCHVLLGRFPEVGNGVMHIGLCAVDWWRQHKDAAGFTGWGKFNAQYWPPTHWMPLPPPPNSEEPGSKP